MMSSLMEGRLTRPSHRVGADMLRPRPIVVQMTGIACRTVARRYGNTSVIATG
jgi:hypothetical protein